MRAAFTQELCRLAGLDRRIWLIVGDLGFSVVEGFCRRFPDRFINAGIAEQNMTGVAAGLAACGKVVFAYSLANFPTLRCLEQLRNDVCCHRGNVKIVSVGGGFAYGAQGYTHHALEDLAIMRALPGMTVVAPADPIEARLATRAIAAHDGPCYLRLGRAGDAIIHATVPEFRLGRALLVRDGRDVTVIATGAVLGLAQAAAQELATEGVRARLLSMPTLKPLDEEAILRAAAETGRIVTVEEHTIHGGLGDAVAGVLAQRAGCDVAFAKIGVPDRIQHLAGSQRYLAGFLNDLPEVVRRMLRGEATGG